MTTVFADSYYFLALINDQDEGHAKAFTFGESFRGDIITTEWVLTEVADALAKPLKRAIFVELLRSVQNNPKAVIIEATHDLFVHGIELFQRRPDKDWSLTDCISFVVMEEHAIREALTGDHHFEQAGFVPLLI